MQPIHDALGGKSDLNMGQRPTRGAPPLGSGGIAGEALC